MIKLDFKLYASKHNRLEMKYIVYMDNWLVLNYVLLDHSCPFGDVAAI